MEVKIEHKNEMTFIGYWTGIKPNEGYVKCPEYCLYYEGKKVGDICDDQLLLKPTPAVLRLMPDAERAYPYEGSKTLMVVVDSVENTDLLEQVFHTMG